MVWLSRDGKKDEPAAAERSRRTRFPGGQLVNNGESNGRIAGTQTEENHTEDGLNNGRNNMCQFPIKLEFKIS